MGRLWDFLFDNGWSIIVCGAGVLVACWRWFSHWQLRMEKAQADLRAEVAEHRRAAAVADADHSRCRADLLERVNRLEVKTDTSSSAQWTAIECMRKEIQDVGSGVARIEGVLSTR